MAIRSKAIIGGLMIVALLALVPLVVQSDYFIGVLTVCFIYGIWTTSWDFMSGLTGRENFGHALFIGAGAYTAAFLDSGWSVDPWWGLLAGTLVAVVCSVIIGVPTLRLKGPYFALATFVAATIVQRLTRVLWQYTGGEEGIPGLNPLFDSHLANYYFCLAALVATAIILLILARSRWGLVLRAIAGDEAACQASGANVTIYKIVSLMISAAFAGFGGVLYADYQLAVTPDILSVVLSITIMIMAYVGGMGTIYGPAGAAILLALLPEMLRGLGEYRLWVYGLVLIFILFFAPGGLIAPLCRRIVGARP